MTSRPKNSVTSNVNRRMYPTFDEDRMRVFGNNMPNGNPGLQGVPLSMNYLNPETFNPSNIQSEPPTLPPRADASRYNRYSSYGNMYSPYNRFSPGMFSYGGCRTPYSRYMPGMPPHDSYNSFIQLAEESTRPAFESIESVVDIVSSISMMLESTYHAVYSSYSAILGVVDQFSRLKDHLAEVVSFIALLRGLKYLCLKILYLLRLKRDNPSVEAAWNTAKSASENSDFSQFHNDPKSPWPFFMFVGLVIGAPWLMFRLLARSAAKKTFNINAWKVDNKGGYVTCRANYTFNTSKRGELPFTAGDCLYIAPKHLQARSPKGWLLACNKNNKVGLVPANYLKGEQVASGMYRVITQRKENITDTSNVSDTNSTKVNVTSEKSDERPRKFPVHPFFKKENSPDPDCVIPCPPISDESSCESEEK